MPEEEIEGEVLITPGKMFESAEEMWWYIDTFVAFIKENRPDIYKEVEND